MSRYHCAPFARCALPVCLLLSTALGGARCAPCLAAEVWPQTEASLPSRSVDAVASSSQTNADPAQLRAIENGIDRLTRDVEARDAKTLQMLGLTEVAAANRQLSIRPRITAAALAPGGALVRLDLLAWGSPDAHTAARVVGKRTLDVWLNRSPVVGSEVFTPDSRHWQPPGDAAEALAEAAGEEWESVSQTPENATAGAILHLVAEKLGGRWIALRRSRWDGLVLDAAHLAGKARTMPGVRERSTVMGLNPNISPGEIAGDVKSWLHTEMTSYDSQGAGIAHFILQRSPNGWVGLGSVWDTDRNTAAEDESLASRQRAAMTGNGYLSADAHRKFSEVLAQVGLYAEAGDEAEKADALEPGSIDEAHLRDLTALRPRDPQAVALWESQNETRIGIGRDHPVFVLKVLAQKQGNSPTVMGSLQIGLEYSKLAQDDRAAAWLKYADDLIARGEAKSLDPNDTSWAEILHDQLTDRRNNAAIKPPNVIRSGLFTLRCWPSDLNTLSVLAGLEAAQHVVYADFGVPMGNTEVVLWRNQSEFQRYTGRQAGEATSEFIAALTLTKLVRAQSGPVVLSEEVNVFTDNRSDTISTLRHEYGHVAVREMSRGRDVPMWLNEGIATSVEGGYEGYIQRVRDARARGTLLSMTEMRQWDVDGERAFLAYSQANSIIDYIGTKWGRGAILDILRLIGRDTPPETALRTVLKVSSQELWNRWAREVIL
jgi:hypothetical protein